MRQRNLRKTAQNFHQLEQQCFKPFQQRMTATKQTITQYVQSETSRQYQGKSVAETSFKSVEEINEGFKAYVNSLKALVTEMGLDEKLCFD